LIVRGTKDFAFREGNRKRFEAAFRKHRTVLFDDASHFLQEDVGEQIAEAFKAFDRSPRPEDRPRLTRRPSKRG
jgi:pimeloyl-ACP methyl ester carboxylesterase